MVIPFLLAIIFAMIKKAKKLGNRQHFGLICWFVIAIIGLSAYTQFLLLQGWKFGIPGADMLNYYDAAQALNDGASWNDLHYISKLYFSTIDLGTLSYFLFSQFISLLIWIPVINMQVTLFFIYFILLCILAISAIDLSEFLCDGKVSGFCIFATLTCAGLIFAAYNLLRDAFIFYFIVQALRYAKKLKEEFPKSIVKNSVLFLICLFFCLILRPYTIIIVFPYMAYIFLGEKIGKITSVAIPAVLVLNTAMIEVLKTFFSYSWNFSSIDIAEVIQFIFFPNIINQSKYIVNWNYYFGYETYLSGSNVPGIYYLMSIWNLFFITLAIIGLLSLIRHKSIYKWVLASSLISIPLLYSIVYDTNSTATRQKIMILIPIVYFAYIGYKKLSNTKICFSANKAISVMTAYTIMFGLIVLILLIVGAY